MSKTLKSPCLSCEKVTRDKNECIKGCEEIRRYQQELKEFEKDSLKNDQGKYSGLYPLFETALGGQVYTSPPEHILDEN